MTSPRLTIALTGSLTGAPSRLLLEQEPSADFRLTFGDLVAMLALVRSGISARTYIAQGCPARIDTGRVLVDLAVRAWPSVADLAYRLHAALPAWTTLGQPEALTEEREFDVVAELTEAIDLPCLATACTATWQSPAITALGEVVEPPEILAYEPAELQPVALAAVRSPISRLLLARPVFGVLRVRCLAHGYRHPITMAIPKDPDTKLSDIRETITATWTQADGRPDAARQRLTLPACVAQLLEACEVDPTRTPGVRSGQVTPPDRVPELRWSTCNGYPIGNVRFVPR